MEDVTDSLIVHAPSMVRWIRHAQTCIAGLKSTSHGYLTNVMSALAEELDDRRPSVGSYISDSKYMKQMAQRYLLKWTGRQEFTRDAARLNALIKNVEKYYNEFKLDPLVLRTKTLPKQSSSRAVCSWSPKPPSKSSWHAQRFKKKPALRKTLP